jgi:glutathione peroxidase
MSIYEHPIAALDGEPFDLEALQGKAVLVVNVASKCGLTPQYTGLEELQRTYESRGFTVLGVPCNQFGGQEPGSADEIATFCSSSYGVTFPITEKVDVNGQKQHELFAELTAKPDAKGEAGEIQWNFEKFLISPTGDVVGRFRPTVAPDSEELVAAVESVLPQ